MDQDDYAGLVHRLEAEAENNPRLFRSKVFLLSNAAYLILLLTFSLLGALCYFGLYWAWVSHHTYLLIKLGIATAVMLPLPFVVLRAFLIRLQPPEGVEIHRKDAPALFSELDKMRRRLKGPAFHRVLVDQQFNASIAQVPRWGLFGGYRNYLVLGLPYLFAMSPQEMLATVAHEYGHVAGNHGKLGAWVYRQRLTFGSLHDKVMETADDNWINRLIATGILWLAPYFNAYTFVLSRQDEYEADKTATELIGADPNATGLIRGDLLARWLNETFWPKLYAQADHHAEPAFKPFGAMRLAFSASVEDWCKQDWLSAAWRVESDLHDTHPCLSDRVKAIGRRAELPPPVDTTAAEVLLGKTAIQLARHFDQTWWQTQQSPWQKRHAYVQESMQKLAQWRTQPVESLSPADLQAFALLSAEFETADQAKSLLRRLLDQPGGPYPKAAYFLGKLLVEENDADGLHHLETAARQDTSLTEYCGRAGYYFLLAARGEQTANDWWDRLFAANS